MKAKIQVTNKGQSKICPICRDSIGDEKIYCQKYAADIHVECAGEFDIQGGYGTATIKLAVYSHNNGTFKISYEGEGEGLIDITIFCNYLNMATVCYRKRSLKVSGHFSDNFTLHSVCGLIKSELCVLGMRHFRIEVTPAEITQSRYREIRATQRQGNQESVRPVFGPVVENGILQNHENQNAEFNNQTLDPLGSKPKPVVQAQPRRNSSFAEILGKVTAFENLLNLPNVSPAQPAQQSTDWENLAPLSWEAADDTVRKNNQENRALYEAEQEKKKEEISKPEIADHLSNKLQKEEPALIFIPILAILVALFLLLIVATKH